MQISKIMKKNNIKPSKNKAQRWESAFLLLFILSCIQRNNQWDPINYNGKTNPTTQYQDSLKTANLQAHADLNSLILKADSLKKLARFADTQYTQKKALADSIVLTSSLVLQKNAATRLKNAVLDTLQKKTCTSLKSALDTVQRVDTIHFSIDLDQAGASANNLYLTGDSIAKKFNTQFFPDTVISSIELYALKSVTDSDVALFQNLVQKQNSAKNVLDSINNSFANTNTALSTENQGILAFNSNIQKTYPCPLPLATADTITKSIPLLKPGDSLFIDVGSYNVQLNIHGISGTPSSHIVIIGSAQGSTVFTASTVLIDLATKYLDIVNITFSGSTKNGAMVQDSAGPVLFQNCAFVKNRGDGIHVLDSHIKLKNCRFFENDSNGVFLQNCSADLENVLVANNHKNGIFVAGYGLNGMLDSTGIVNATVSDNDSDGVFQQGGYSYVAIDKSLVTFNKRIGIHREVQITVNAPLFLSSSDLYMNSHQDLLSLPPFDSLQHLSQDPVYVNKANYNYSIGPASMVPDSLGYKGQ